MLEKKKNLKKCNKETVAEERIRVSQLIAELEAYREECDNILFDKVEGEWSYTKNPDFNINIRENPYQSYFDKDEAERIYPGIVQKCTKKRAPKKGRKCSCNPKNNNNKGNR